MTWRDLGWLLVSCTLGFAISLVAVLLLLLVVTGMFWWYGIEPIMRARASMDRWMLSYGHTEVLEQRVQRADRDPGRRRRPLREPSCAGSSATSTTAPRHGWSRCR